MYLQYLLFTLYYRIFIQVNDLAAGYTEHVETDDLRDVVLSRRRRFRQSLVRSFSPLYTCNTVFRNLMMFWSLE